MSNFMKIRNINVHDVPMVGCPIPAESELNQFHFNMVNQNSQLNLLAVQCYLYQGEEILLYKTEFLRPIREALINADIEFHDILKQLARTLLQALKYQLDENCFVYENQFIYVDLTDKSVKLIYLPLKALNTGQQVDDFKKLIESWLQIPSVVSALSKEEILALSVILREQYSKLRPLVEQLASIFNDKKNQDRLPKDENLLKHSDVKMGDRSIAEQNEIRAIEANKKREKFKKLSAIREKSHVKAIKTKNEERLNTNFSSLPKKWIAATSGFVLGTLLIIYLLPIERETKLGVLLIVLALGALGFSKLKVEKPIQSQHQDKKTLHAMTKDEHDDSKWRDGLNAAFEHSFEDAFENEALKEEPVLREQFGQIGKTAEETVIIQMNQCQRTLLIRKATGAQYMLLSKDIFTIGRNANLCDVFIDEPSVGRLHAELHTSGESVYVRDLNSLNGTYINGHRIATNQYQSFQIGDKLVIGKQEMILT